MKILSKRFRKAKDNTQRTYIPKIWYGNYDCPNFKSRTIVIRFWDGYWGLDLTK